MKWAGHVARMREKRSATQFHEKALRKETIGKT
jgi:hypothetical protein